MRQCYCIKGNHHFHLSKKLHSHSYTAAVLLPIGKTYIFGVYCNTKYDANDAVMPAWWMVAVSFVSLKSLYMVGDSGAWRVLLQSSQPVLRRYSCCYLYCCP